MERLRPVFQKDIDLRFRDQFKCSVCYGAEKTLIHIGDKPDYDAEYVRVCKTCLSKALRMFRQSNRRM